MDGAIEGGLEESAKYYEEWNEEVKRCVPREKLLIFNVKQGWKPLCDFLEIRIPKDGHPFPHVNDTKEFQKNSETISHPFCYYNDSKMSPKPSYRLLHLLKLC